MSNFSSFFGDVSKQFERLLEELEFKDRDRKGSLPWEDRESLEESLCVFSRRLFSCVVRSADQSDATSNADRCLGLLRKSLELLTIEIFRDAVARRVTLLECLVQNGLEEFDRQLKIEAKTATEEASHGKPLV